MVLAAGYDLTVATADDTHTEDHSLVVNTYGLRRAAQRPARHVRGGQGSADTTPTGSLIGSTDGAVTLSASQDVHLTGSDVLSQAGTAIVGQNVSIAGSVRRARRLPRR